MSTMKAEEFIRANAVLMAPPLVPEIQLYLATEVVPLWRKTEEELAVLGVPPPYWAFAWAGGQALARHVLDNPTLVRGKRVLDIGSGSGLVGIAASRAGAAHVLAADIDSFACAAIALNAAANDAAIAVTAEDVIGLPNKWDVILVGDLFYERPLAERLLAWLTPFEIPVLLGDPGRNYFPTSGIDRLASYTVQTSRELEDREIRDTAVYRMSKG
jgi:predicted nicotinamide N-methyase